MDGMRWVRGCGDGQERLGSRGPGWPSGHTPWVDVCVVLGLATGGHGSRGSENRAQPSSVALNQVWIIQPRGDTEYHMLSLDSCGIF